MGMEGFGACIPSRDEFGLPDLKEQPKINLADEMLDKRSPRETLSEIKKSDASVPSKDVPNPFKDKMKSKVGDSTLNSPDAEVLEDSPKNVSKKSWSQPTVEDSPVVVAVSDKKSLPVKGPVVTKDTGTKEQPNTLQKEESDWQQVKRKNSNPVSAPSSAASGSSVAHDQKATPALPIFTALSRTLSKSQRKKAKKSGEKIPTLKH
ncbi:hypothetical protein ACET3Z_028198 [Daucus carota]